MPSDFYSMELSVRERISSKYQEAEAERLANTVTRKKRPIRYSMRKSAGQVLREVAQVVKDVIHHNKQPSPIPRQ